MSLSGLQQLHDLIAELEIVVGNGTKCQSLVSPVVTSANKGQTLKVVPSSVTKTGVDNEEDSVVKKNGEKKAVVSRTKEIILPDEININSLDLRVGVIRSVIRHADAEKLYCEDIDVGESELRPIASGLVPFYSLDEMLGRRVIVVANLLPRKLVGFKSNGMVLCATKKNSEGVESVEFVDPPAGAVAGERIIGLGLSSLPLSAKQCDKRKAFEILSASLCVDDEGIARWDGMYLVSQSSGEYCRAPTLRDCPIH